jgi:hypothetical protein
MEISTMTRPRFDSHRPTLETLEDRLVPSTVAGSYADGVWRFDTSAGWTHISNFKAVQLKVDDAGDVYGSFPNKGGLWRWSASSASWMKLSSLNVQQFQVTATGVLYGDFNSNGVWRWDPSIGWMKLSDFDVGGITVSVSDAFFGEFQQAGVQGLWRWTPTAGWSLLTGNRPDTLKTDDAGEFVGVFETFIAAGQVGTWRWNPSTGWARLSTATPITLAVSSNGAIFENRSPDGIWRVAPGANSFTQINPATTTFELITALSDGGLVALGLNASGTPEETIWYWNPNLQGLGFITIINDATNIVPDGVGKDGDQFFDSGIHGTGYWSLQSPYHLLAGNTQDPGFLASQR